MSNPIQKSSLWVGLVSSFSTLICCTIPAILVILGAGSTLVALVGMFPQLIWLSEHKVGLFIFSGVMLCVSGYLNWKRRNVCPIDPVIAKNCQTTKKWSSWIWWISVILYLIGLGVAYIIPFFMSF